MPDLMVAKATIRVLEKTSRPLFKKKALLTNQRNRTLRTLTRRQRWVYVRPLPRDGSYGQRE
jgi:hypothetical protein